MVTLDLVHNSVDALAFKLATCSYMYSYCNAPRVLHNSVSFISVRFIIIRCFLMVGRAWVWLIPSFAVLAHWKACFTVYYTAKLGMRLEHIWVTLHYELLSRQFFFFPLSVCFLNKNKLVGGLGTLGAITLYVHTKGIETRNLTRKNFYCHLQLGYRWKRVTVMTTLTI